jgi:nicotinate dehydrogenase subunit B
MTGFMHEKEFSRKSFLKGGGAMIVGLTFAGVAQAANYPKEASPVHTGFNPGPLDLNQVDSFIAIHSDNTASIYSGRVDLGQGTPNGLLMIIGEELDMDLSQLTFIPSDTNVTPDTGVTVGSSSITQAGPRLRAAGAYAKQALLGLAATNLGVAQSSLTVKGGVVSGGGKTVTYGQLIGDKVFNVAMGSQTLNPGVSPAKSPNSYKLVTTSPPRLDIPDKVSGKYTYIHNIRLPGMLHGRLIRPRGQGAYGTGVKLLSIDENSIKNIPNTRIVRRGDFVAVVAPKEYDAIQAAAQVKVKWQDNPLLPGDGNIVSQQRAQDAAGKTQNTVTTTGNVDAALASAAKVLSATYKYDYQMHGPIGPCCAVAAVTPSSALVITNTQGTFRLRTFISKLINMAEPQIRIQYVEGASAFGHCETDDAACAAAITSQLLGGTPVRLQFMRWDDHGWDNYGPQGLWDVRAGIDASGKIVGYDNAVWAMSGTNSGETTQEIAGFGPITTLGVASGNSGPTAYSIANRRGVGKSVPVLNGGYLKTAPLRSPSSPNNFPAEQMIDELAHAANMDPLAFRILNAGSQRTIESLNSLAQIANWKPKVSASKLSNNRIVYGRGVALANPGGVVTDVEVDKKTGKIRILHMTGVQDVGLAISPGLVENQMVGSLIQTASRALHEGISYTKSEVTSTDWVTYPIMRFKDHPSVTTAVFQRTDQVPTGAGEPLVPGTPASIANAFFDATGVRIRQVPMTPARVRAALKAAGVA